MSSPEVSSDLPHSGGIGEDVLFSSSSSSSLSSATSIFSSFSSLSLSSSSLSPSSSFPFSFSSSPSSSSRSFSSPVQNSPPCTSCSSSLSSSTFSSSPVFSLPSSWTSIRQRLPHRSSSSSAPSDGFSSFPSNSSTVRKSADCYHLFSPSSSSSKSRQHSSVSASAFSLSSASRSSAVFPLTSSATKNSGRTSTCSNSSLSFSSPRFNSTPSVSTNTTSSSSGSSSNCGSGSSVSTGYSAVHYGRRGLVLAQTCMVFLFAFSLLLGAIFRPQSYKRLRRKDLLSLQRNSLIHFSQQINLHIPHSSSSVAHPRSTSGHASSTASAASDSSPSTFTSHSPLSQESLQNSTSTFVDLSDGGSSVLNPPSSVSPGTSMPRLPSSLSFFQLKGQRHPHSFFDASSPIYVCKEMDYFIWQIPFFLFRSFKHIVFTGDFWRLFWKPFSSFTSEGLSPPPLPPRSSVSCPASLASLQLLFSSSNSWKSAFEQRLLLRLCENFSPSFLRQITTPFEPPLLEKTTTLPNVHERTKVSVEKEGKGEKDVGDDGKLRSLCADVVMNDLHIISLLSTYSALLQALTNVDALSSREKTIDSSIPRSSSSSASFSDTAYAEFNISSSSSSSHLVDSMPSGENLRSNTSEDDFFSQAVEIFIDFNGRFLGDGPCTPCYPFNDLFRRCLSGYSGVLPYAILLFGWLSSLFSTHPLTLIHFPRLLFYISLGVYRFVFLYYLGNTLERNMAPEYDYSDHIVLYLFFLLIASIEWSAVARAHTEGSLWISAVRFYYSVVVGGVMYLGFFTSLYFHPPAEIWLGFLIGLVGLFGLFWVLVSLEKPSLLRIGIMRVKRIRAGISCSASQQSQQGVGHEGEFFGVMRRGRKIMAALMGKKDGEQNNNTSMMREEMEMIDRGENSRRASCSTVEGGVAGGSVGNMR